MEFNQKSQRKDTITSNEEPDSQKNDEDQQRVSITKAFLTNLGTAREISRPIKVENSGHKVHPLTADEYEIPYNPRTERNHPLEKWRRSPIYRCLLTREIARYLDRKTFLTVSVREGLIYCVFLILLSLITFGSFTLEKFYLTETMISRYKDTSFDLEDFNNDKPEKSGQTITFRDINTIEHIWQYQVYIIENLLFEPFWNTPDQLYENKMMGPAQIRQIRVKNNTCQTWKEIFKTSVIPPCYGPYTEKDEEKGLLKTSATALIAWLAKVNIWRTSIETGALPLGGILTTYGGGGYVVEVQSTDDGNQVVAALKSVKWYTRATRAIVNEFTIYNGNSNLFCIFKLLFEIPPTGGVIPSAWIYVKQLIRYDNSHDYFILGCEIICMLFIVLYTLQKILEIITLRKKLIKSFWNYIDLMILITAYMTCVYNLQLYNAVVKLVPKLADPISEDKFISFDIPLHLHNMYSRCFAVLIAFSFLRLVKYFSVINSMYQLQMTIFKGLPELLNFMVFFFYFYFVFAMVGVFLFGGVLEDFKTFTIALYSLMKYSIADFDAASLTQADPVLGPVFFFAYLFLIVFTLANLFLAILVSKYQEVRSEVRIGGAKTFLKDMLKIWFLQLLGNMECPWLLSQIEREEFEEKVKSPTEQVRFYLRQAGYSELEIELFFKKYDITDSKIEAMDESTMSFRKGEREAPPPLSQKDIMRYIVIQKLEYLENHYQQASKLIDEFLNKLGKFDRKRT